MPLVTNPMNNPGPSLPANQLPAQAAEQISNAIGLITAGNMFGGVGGIPNLQDVFGWRVDRQNAPAEFLNLSVQRNDVNAPSTVASVFVPLNYNIGPPPPNAPNAGPGGQDVYQARISELERAVRRGLEASFGSYAAPPAPPTPNARTIDRYVVSGNFSA